MGLHLQSCRRRPIAIYKQLKSINCGLRHNGWYWRTEVLHDAPARNVLTRRKGPVPGARRRDLLGRDPRRTGPRPRRDRDVSTSRDGLETETSRPRPHPCFSGLNPTCQVSSMNPSKFSEIYWRKRRSRSLQ